MATTAEPAKELGLVDPHPQPVDDCCGEADGPGHAMAGSLLAAGVAGTAVPPRLTPSMLAVVQRGAGNAAAVQLLGRSRLARGSSAGVALPREPATGGPTTTDPTQEDGLAERQSVRLQRVAGDVAVSVQRAGPVDDAIGNHSADAVSALSDGDIAKATIDQRIQMIGIVLSAGGGDALRRLWDSFGGQIDSVATAHQSEWDQSIGQHTDVMRLSREVKTYEGAFPLDISDVAWAYLRENDKVVVDEMQRLGIPEKEGDTAPPTAAQAAELQKAQAAAGKLKEAQETREQLRQTEIAYHDKVVEKGGTELPEGGVEDLEHTYDPVFFDPDNKFDVSNQPTDYLPGLRTWEDTDKQHVELTNVIKSYFIAYPSLYALSRGDDSGAKAGGAATATPAEARTILGDQLRTVRQNIAKTRGLVPTLALQMTPIQDQLLSGKVGAGIKLKQDWSKPFLHSIGQDVVAQQQPGPWWEELGLMGLEAAAYVVVGLASGGLGPVLLAGGQAAISVAKYQALETASRANVTPDTVLIQDGEVVAAAVQAIITTAAAFIAAVGAARGLFAARLASQVGRSLATELGEDVARRLLLELSPEAAQALKNKLGAEALKDLAFRLSGPAIEKMAQELTGAEIKALIGDVGWEALERLSKDIGGKAVQSLARDLGGATLRKLGEEVGAADIQAMITKHGADGVKWLAQDLSGSAAKQLADQLTADALKELQDIGAKDAAGLVDKLGADAVNDLAGALKGKGLQDLSGLGMFRIDPKFAAKISAANAVKGLGPLEGRLLPEIETKLSTAGFSKTASKGGQDIWTHPDGSIVRLKVGPDALKGQRTMPHVVREISDTPGAFGTKDIIAKVTEDGTVVPAGPKHAGNDLKVWFVRTTGRQPTAAEMDSLSRIWADATHVDITVP